MKLPWGYRVDEYKFEDGRAMACVTISKPRVLLLMVQALIASIKLKYVD